MSSPAPTVTEPTRPPARPPAPQSGRSNKYTAMTGAELSLAPEVMRRADMEDSRALVEHGALLATQDDKMFGIQTNDDAGACGHTCDCVHLRSGRRSRLTPQVPVLRKVIGECDERVVYRRGL